jgi:Skp family chaperone for outer membrane proteins
MSFLTRENIFLKMRARPKIIEAKSGMHFLVTLFICMLLLITTTVFSQDVQSKTAFVNETRIRKEYREMLENHAVYVMELEEAARKMGEKLRELDSLNQEAIYANASSNYQVDKELAIENHHNYLQELGENYKANMALSMAKVEKVIKAVVKDSTHKQWQYVTSEDAISEEVDVTTAVLEILNQ